MTPVLTPDRVRHVIDYDPIAGTFLWKRRPSKEAKNVRRGRPAGRMSCSGRSHRWVSLDCKRIALSRVAWAIMKGEWPPGRLAFRDGNPDNLVWKNIARQNP